LPVCILGFDEMLVFFLLDLEDLVHEMLYSYNCFFIVHAFLQGVKNGASGLLDFGSDDLSEASDCLGIGVHQQSGEGIENDQVVGVELVEFSLDFSQGDRDFIEGNRA